MNSKLFRTFLLTIVATVSLTFSSCETDPPYTTPLLGVWELYYINDIKVNEGDIDKFRFNLDGTGTYAYWNRGRWVQDPFNWTSQYNSLLTITFISDWKSYTMSYRISGYDGALEIYNSTLFNGKHVYFPVDRSSK